LSISKDLVSFFPLLAAPYSRAETIKGSPFVVKGKVESDFVISVEI